jgi:hypothetical protein
VNKLVFASAFLFLIPTLWAQQAEPKADSSQTAPQADPQPAPHNSDAQSNLPASLRPGHPLDAADVDILTGKRDREMEAARAAGTPVSVGGYDNYGYQYADGGRFGSAFDVGLLPLTQIGNPFFFSRLQLRGFGRGAFGRGRFRGTR